jgi:hypothetical protein
MTFEWDKTGDRIWYGKWADEWTGFRLFMTVERLPRGQSWDWTVWEAAGPKIVRRGIEPTAAEAVAAAEATVVRWRELNPMREYQTGARGRLSGKET